MQEIFNSEWSINLVFDWCSLLVLHGSGLLHWFSGVFTWAELHCPLSGDWAQCKLLYVLLFPDIFPAHFGGWKTKHKNIRKSISSHRAQWLQPSSLVHLQGKVVKHLFMCQTPKTTEVHTHTNPPMGLESEVSHQFLTTLWTPAMGVVAWSSMPLHSSSYGKCFPLSWTPDPGASARSCAHWAAPPGGGRGASQLFCYLWGPCLYNCHLIMPWFMGYGNT